MNSESYTDLFNIFCLMLQMISGIFNKAKLELFKYNDFPVLTIIFFYLPFVFIVVFLISYMYLGVMMFYCQKSKEEMENRNELDFHIGFKEFFKLTYQILTEKPKKIKVTFQISDQTVHDIKLTEIFYDFQESVDLKDKFRTMELWAYNCAKTLMTEYQQRKRVKKLAKEILQAMLYHETDSKQEMSKIDVNIRLADDKFRLKYWEYFRIGNLKLLGLMNYFDYENQLLEKYTLNPSFLKKKKMSEYKIKKYILYLEKQNAKNMEQIKQLVAIIEKYSRKSFIDSL